MTLEIEVTTVRRQSVFALILLVALVLVGSVFAQATALSYGTPVQGTISGVKFQEDWTLSTASADRMTVRVERSELESG